MDFNESNKKGKQFELFLYNKLIELGFGKPEFAPDKLFPQYDLSLQLRLKLVKFEAKNDVLAHHKYPNNLCVEYAQYLGNIMSNRKLSGIMTTESDYWVHSDGIEFDDAVIYLAHSMKIFEVTNKFLKFYDDFIEFRKLMSNPRYDNVYDDRLSDFLEKSRKEMDDNLLFDDIYPTMHFDVKKYHPVEQADKTYKMMDLCIFRKKVFTRYSIEIAGKNEITFDELKKYK